MNLISNSNQEWASTMQRIASFLEEAILMEVTTPTSEEYCRVERPQSSNHSPLAKPTSPWLYGRTETLYWLLEDLWTILASNKFNNTPSLGIFGYSTHCYPEPLVAHQLLFYLIYNIGGRNTSHSLAWCALSSNYSSSWKLMSVPN